MPSQAHVYKLRATCNLIIAILASERVKHNSTSIFFPYPPFPGCDSARGGLGNKDSQNPKESCFVFNNSGEDERNTNIDINIARPLVLLCRREMEPDG